MKIKVTQDHINNGKPISATECPIALAVNKALGIKGGRVTVNNDRICYWGSKSGSPIWIHPTPDLCVNFIRSFDGITFGKDPVDPVQPFEFNLDIPSNT